MTTQTSSPGAAPDLSTQTAFINAPVNLENARCAIVREYLAILLQQIGWRAAARYLRARPLRRRTDITSHPGDTSLPAPALHCGDDEAQPEDGSTSATSAMNPFIVDTGAERHLQFSGNALQSRMRLDQPDALVAAYTRQMMSFLLFNPDPAHVLMIGLGGGSLPKFCYRHLPKARITVVEIDAQVIALRESFYIPADDNRFRIIHDDGARYIARLDRPVDAILIDAFDEAGVAPSLASSTFFREASRHLTSQGVLIMNLHGDPERYAGHLERASAEFGNRALLARVTANDNVLLCAFRADVTPPAARHLELRANYLQSRFRLHFPSYLQRIREGQAVKRSLPPLE